MLSSGVWEPEVIVKKLPDFLMFLNEVQDFLFREMKKTELTRAGEKRILV